MDGKRQFDGPDEQDILDCVAELLSTGEAEDWSEAYEICSTDVARAKPLPPERRSAKLEVRAKGRRLEGYAAVFNTEARIGDFREVVSPGAFARSLAGDVVALLDHDPGRVLARTKSKTLRLAEDSKGLAFDLDVPATTFGSDALALAKRGDLGGMSFGFRVAKDGEKWDGNKRTLTNVDLKEISVVSAWPAYTGTTVNARAKATHGSRMANFRLALAKRYLDTL
jgi:HK97 family phage prohead protease